MNIYVFFEFFNEREREVVRQFGDVVEERRDHVVLNAQLRQLVVGVLRALARNDLLQDVSDRLLVLLVVQSLCGQDPGSTVPTAASHGCRVLRASLRSAWVSRQSRRANLPNRGGAKLLLRLDAAHLFLGPDLGDALVEGAHVDVHDFDALVVVDV